MRGQTGKIVIGATAVAVTVALVLFNRGRDHAALEASRHVHFICHTDGCGAEFEMSIRQLSRGGSRCPDCDGIQIANAHPCPACGKMFPLGAHGSLPPNCVHCNYKFGDWSDIAHIHGPDGEHILTATPPGQETAEDQPPNAR